MSATMKVPVKNKYFSAPFKLDGCKNIVEALSRSNFFRRLGGISVFVLKVGSDNRVTREISTYGLLFYIVWYAIYVYCTYKAHYEDQTILRIIYSTKLQRYGDDYERISSTAFIIFAYYKIPFGVNINKVFISMTVDLDKALENLGENVDYRLDALLALVISISQIALSTTRFFSIWLTIYQLDVPIPLERMHQVICSDTLALIATAHYCFYVKVIKSRFQHMNKILEDIKNHKSWEYKLFTRGSMVANVQKAKGLEDKYICEKIKACGKIHSMLYKMIEANNKMFGSMIMLTVLVYISYITLYMFYFMEATAAGLFHHPDKYAVLFIYVLWEIGYASVTIYVIVYISEYAAYEAQKTSFILHDIMNSDFSPAVAAEALQLSVQCLHQRPIFTAYGLYELNYETLQETE
nr:putative gustatory receptor 28a [Helicoverpa armigera]